MEPSLGAMLVGVRVAGNGRDPDGYSITVGTRTFTVAGGDTLRIGDLTPGAYPVVLGGLASHCTTGREGLAAQIVGGAAPAEVWFDVECYSDLVYSESHAAYDDELYYFDADGKNRRLTEPMEGGQWNATWSPDGSRVVFIRIRGSGLFADETDLYVADLEGNAWPIADRVGQGETQPAWSPDGSWIAYSLSSGVSAYTESGIRLVRPDGTDDHPLLDGDRLDLSPAWSPDGKWIAFGCWKGVTGICIARPDGSDLFRAPVELGAPHGLAWSPDGAHLAFRSSADGKAAIRFLNLDSWEVRSAFPEPGGFGPVFWAPDGKSFLALGGTGIHLVDVRQTAYRTIADPIRWGGDWSPDGARVSFSNQASAIEISDSEGTGRRVIHSGGTVLNARWRHSRPAAAASLSTELMPMVPEPGPSPAPAGGDFRCRTKADPVLQVLESECSLAESGSSIEGA